MQIGDKIKFTPSAFEGEWAGQGAGKPSKPRQLTGTVIYIHPKGRFFTLAAKVGGVTIRESFQIPPRIDAAPPPRLGTGRHNPIKKHKSNGKTG